jgi:hypothetical protein
MLAKIVITEPIILAIIGTFSTLGAIVLNAAFNYLMEWLKTRREARNAPERETEAVKETNKKRALDFEHVRRKIEDIDAVLYDVLIQANASRVVLHQYHNGGKFFSGDCMLHLTCTNEAARVGVPRIQKEFQNMLISADMFKHLSRLHYTGCHTAEVGKMEDTEVRHFLSLFGVEELFECVLTDDYGLPIATMAVHFNETGNVKNENVAFSRLSANKIQNMLLEARDN